VPERVEWVKAVEPRLHLPCPECELEAALADANAGLRAEEGLEPAWRKALAEVARVLKPGGRFFFEWVTSRALRLPYPLLTEGFGSMQPPTPGLFFMELQSQGIAVGGSFVSPKLAALTGWVGDLVGVGWRGR